MAKIKEMREEIAAKSAAIAKVFEEAGEDMDFAKVKSLDGDTQAKLDQIKTMNTELDTLHKRYEESEELVKAAIEAKDINKLFNTPENGAVHPDAKAGGSKPMYKSIGELFMESKASEMKEVGCKVEGIDLKTLFQTSAGWDPEEVRIPRVELYPLRKLMVMDHFPMYATTRDLIKYMKETTFTNNAAEAAAGGTYGEAEIVLGEGSDEVEKVATWLPVTDEQLEDVDGIASYLNGRLTYMVQARIDSQLLVGDGSTPNLLGTLNLAAIQTQAKASDPVPDAIHKAFTKIRAVGFAEPTVLFLHPNDWQGIRLLRTADGIYIFGSPQDAGVDRIWGVNVAQTTAETEGTGCAGDYAMYAGIFMKRGIEFKVTNAHSDFFISGKQAIRADVRLASVHFRDTAFCEITGI